MNRTETTTVCIITPAGRGAVAVVEVHGPEAVKLVAARFRSASGWQLIDIPTGRIAFGRWATSKDEAGEEVVVTRSDDGVEIHCHGGMAASRAIARSLAELGATEIDHAEWTLSVPSDAITTQAAMSLTQVQTERAALVLLDQQQGALSLAVESIIQLLETGDSQAAASELQQLAGRWPLGKRLTQPARIVITGPPNVGKSSLLNALVGYDRAIVFDRPGTTRDVVTATTAIDGWAVELLDTAGLRRAAEGIESAGMQLAREELAKADLVLLVGEAKTWLAGETPAGDFAEWYHQQPLLGVASKCDLLTSGEQQKLARRSAELLLTSAVTSPGVEPLLRSIAKLVVPTELPVGTAVPFEQHQMEAIQAARDSLSTGETLTAKKSLESMLVFGRR